MKFSLAVLIVLLQLLLPAAAGTVAAQDQPKSVSQPQPQKSEAKSEKRAAKLLYEEAKSYLDTAFNAFNKQKIPYDQKLEAKTKQEQKDLAAKYAAILETRKSLSEGDSYYLGMLHYLAGNGEGALLAMRRYLSGEPSGKRISPPKLRMAREWNGK